MKNSLRIAAIPLLIVAVVWPQVPGRRGGRGPVVESVSVRWESSWAEFRTAAADLLGWQVGIPSSTFDQVTFWDAAAKADALGLAYIEGFGAQSVGPQISKNLDYNLTPEELTAVRTRLRSLRMQMPAYRVDSVGSDEASRRKLFEFAKALGATMIVASPETASLGEIDKLANDVGIDVAIANPNPKGLVAALEGRSKRLGAYVDIGAWMQAGVKPLEGVTLLKERLMAVNLRDCSSEPGLLEGMYKMGLKPLFLVLDSPGVGDKQAALAKVVAGFERALQPVMTDRVYQISRTMPIRGPEQLAADMKAKIAAAIPKEAPAKPKKPRKMLVMDLNIGWIGHDTIRHANLMLDLMGKNTGAFVPVFSNDLDNLRWNKIRQFDAIFLNSTVGQVFVDPEIRSSLLRFIRGGGGLAALHGVSYTDMDWPEFTRLIGAGEGPHRVEKATIKIDDPASPLNASFGGKEFEYVDEFYHFYANGPYSRDRLHVLLSIDVQKSDMSRWGSLARGFRPDNDYGLSWIQNYGKGRVFYCALGHTPELFTTPALTAHLLAGIQFALGDLAADATPSAKLK